MSFSGDLYPSGGASVVMTTNGDTIYYNSGRQRLPKGSDADVLTLASGLPSWSAPSGGATTTYTDEKLSSDFTTDVAVSGGDPVDVTGLAITLGGDGKFIVEANGYLSSSGATNTAPVWDIVHDGTIIRRMGQIPTSFGEMYTSTSGGSCDSTIVKLQVNSPAGITTVRGTGDYLTGLWIMEIA